MAPQPSLGDRAVLVAGFLAIIVVALVGTQPQEGEDPAVQTAQATKR